mmetsp:Transcript_35753/g.83195  ORF Transcript_35753/g.83195 Transcript_35753/m.83195 type:complete len:193 (-) Transcript_35753:133-711(-)
MIIVSLMNQRTTPCSNTNCFYLMATKRCRRETTADGIHDVVRQPSDVVERPQRTGSTTSFGNQAMSSRDQNGRDPRRRSVVDFRRGNAAPARRTMRRRDRLSARAAKADERRENVRDAPCNRLNFERRAPSFFHSDPGLKTIGVTWGRCRHCGVDEGKQRHSPPPTATTRRHPHRTFPPTLRSGPIASCGPR